MGIEDKINATAAEVRNTPGMGKSMAKWGALGAVIAIPLPLVGPPLGAIAGAIYAYRKHKKAY
jgi:uncharacterized membrane protein